jgi:uncharacterized membrane protein
LLWDATNQIPFTGRALNNRGEVAGWVTTTTSGGTFPHAATWRSGEVTRLPETDSTFSSLASALNDRGVIVGRIDEWTVGWGAVWQGGALSMLGDMEGELNVSPLAINNRGQIAVVDYLGRAFLWSADAGFLQAQLPALPGGNSPVPADVNDSGHAAGWDNTGYPGGQSTQRAVLWRDETVEFLGTLPGMSDSHANALDGFDRVVGFSSNAGTAVQRAFLWRHGEMKALPLLHRATRQSSVANDINDWGQIVGSESSAGGTAYAVLWERGRVFDLNSLVREADRLGPHVSLRAAQRINLWGQILVTAHDDRIPDTELTYLLTPTLAWLSANPAPAD